MYTMIPYCLFCYCLQTIVRFDNSALHHSYNLRLFLDYIYMKIYFDTTTWIRIYEELDDQTQIEERDAIDSLLELLQDDDEILTSKFQINQMYSFLNSANRSNDEKDAITKALAHCEEKCRILDSSDPYCKAETDELIQEASLNHREDARHIVISWRKEADYFITTDRELFHDKRGAIENALNKMWHPTAAGNSKRLIVLNPIDFLHLLQK